VTDSYIYFIQVENGGPIKIGITGNDPRHRMVKIQSDCPWPVILLGAIKGSLEQEAALHCQLDEFNIQGEWFAPAEAVLAAVQSALGSDAAIQFPRKKAGPKYDHPLCKYRNHNDLTLKEVAERVGDVEHASLSRIESGKQKPSLELAARISKATGIHIRELRPDIYRIFYPAETAQ
jgi:DNA-binding XRE family transcriptional regulator